MIPTDRLIWLDLEMTGLDPDQQVILEIGSIVTDSELNIVAKGPMIAINHPEAILSTMESWSQEHHGKSGLTDRCRASQINLHHAEQETLEFLKQHCAAKSSPLCGNSIGQDRRFLYKYMPTLNDYFHYRNVDVSTIKEVVKRWYPASAQAPEKRKTHHVLDDIHESIDELRHYRKTVFK
jgi:oligoribonuclease